MKRYIVKNKKEWAVVNADKKKSIKILKTQREAIDFARSLTSTTVIVVQGRDGKFIRHENIRKQKVRYVPKYVYKHTEITKKTSLITILAIVSIIFIIIAAIFWGLYIGGELDG